MPYSVCNLKYLPGNLQYTSKGDKSNPKANCYFFNQLLLQSYLIEEALLKKNIFFESDISQVTIYAAEPEKTGYKRFVTRMRRRWPAFPRVAILHHSEVPCRKRNAKELLILDDFNTPLLLM